MRPNEDLSPQSGGNTGRARTHIDNTPIDQEPWPPLNFVIDTFPHHLSNLMIKLYN